MSEDKNAVCILASINVDMVVEVDDFPRPGETVMGHSYQKFYGGKGANQAVAARRIGAEVYVLGKVGRDELGKEYLANFQNNKIRTEGIGYSETEATGMAMINVDVKGENNIIVIPGANAKLTESDVEKAESQLKAARVAVSQFEVPVNVTKRFFELARKQGCITVFNPAPANKIPEDMVPYIDVLIPNEVELGLITGMETENDGQVKQAAESLIEKGIPYVLVTLGGKGSMLVSENMSSILPPQKVKAVDTTAAGDSYVGALAAKLAQENELNEEVLLKCGGFATRVAALAVQRKGAQASLPYLEELEK